jgi:hypothetical protein
MAKEKDEEASLEEPLRNVREIEASAQAGVERGDRSWEGIHNELVGSLTKKLLALGAGELLEAA